MANYAELNLGKADLGIDGLLPLLIYIIIKVKPKRFFSDYTFISLYMSQDLSKRKYGSILTQIGACYNFIKELNENETENSNLIK